jgi:hypothetical protein
MFKDIPGVLGKTGDVIAEVSGNVTWVRDQLLKIKLAFVVKGKLGLALKDRFDRIRRQTFGLREIIQDCLLGGLQHTIQPAKHGKGQDHAAIFGLFIITAQKLGDTPNKIRAFFEIIDHWIPFISLCLDGNDVSI